MPISGSRRYLVCVRPVRLLLFCLPVLVIPACVLFHYEPLQQNEPPQLLIDPDLDKAVTSEVEPAGWRLEADPATPGLRTGPMEIRRTRGLGISQQASGSEPGEVNAWVQRIENPPVGEWYRFYLECGVNDVSPGGVRIDLRFYDAAGELILSNGWVPEVAGTVPFHWGETEGAIPAECTRVEVMAGLDRSASGTFVLQKARFELRDPIVREILTEGNRIIEGGLHLTLTHSGQDILVVKAGMENGIWFNQYTGLPGFCTYTLRGKDLDLKLKQGFPYRDENGYELIGNRTWWIRGSFEEHSLNSIIGSFKGVCILMSTPPETDLWDREGTVTGYLTLGGVRVDSLGIRSFRAGRRPPPPCLPF